MIDDTLFRLIASRREVCQEILRTLLGSPDLVVHQVTVQAVMAGLHREVTLDALCELAELMRLFLRREAFEHEKFRELSKAVRYFKGSE